MRKTNWCFFCIFTFFLFVSVKDSSPQIKILQENETNQLLINDTVLVNTGPLDIELFFVNYDLTGDALQFISENRENPKEGFSFNFKAIKPGEAIIKLILQNMKKGYEGIIRKSYKLIVTNDSGLTKVNAVDIFNNPKNFTDGLY